MDNRLQLGQMPTYLFSSVSAGGKEGGSELPLSGWVCECVSEDCSCQSRVPNFGLPQHRVTINPSCWDHDSH